MATRTIRLFLSSTFRDFGEERDLLVKRVFPDLRARLRDRFVELMDVDLRWGITAEEAERGEVLPICLAEIDRARPYFICMLGERYGWIPPSTVYARNLLERQPWLSEHRGGKSVTELEILHGVLNNPKMAGRAYFYFRAPDYARSQAGDFICPTPEEREKLTSLKNRIRSSGFPLRENYSGPEDFAAMVMEDLWDVLEQEFPISEIPDEYERLSLEHARFAASRRNVYVGFESSLQKIGEWIEAGDHPIFVVTGPAGSGKSALLANWTSPDRDVQHAIWVFEHYFGASPGSADVHLMLRRLYHAISTLTGFVREIPMTPESLRSTLPVWLSTLSTWAELNRRKCVLVLDGLDHLDQEEQRLDWLPENWPAHVSLLSAMAHCGAFLKLENDGHVTFKIEELETADAEILIGRYLARFGKKLPANLGKRIAEHPSSKNPLFVKVLLDDLRIFGEHERLSAKLDWYLESGSVAEVYAKILERLESDLDSLILRQTLSLIALSRSGLSEDELLELLGALRNGVSKRLPRAYFSPVLLSLGESLTESHEKLVFFHKDLALAVHRRYLSKKQDQRRMRMVIADYFLSRSGVRRFEECSYQFQKLESRNGLRILLDDPLIVLTEGLSHLEIVRAFQFLGGDPALLKRIVRRICSLADSPASEVAESWSRIAYQIGAIELEGAVVDHWLKLGSGKGEQAVRASAALRHRLGDAQSARMLLTEYLGITPRSLGAATDLISILCFTGAYEDAEALALKTSALHAERLSQDAMLNATFLHKCYFVKHDLERNLEAVRLKRQILPVYTANFKTYDALIARVNLGDALWAVGSVSEGERQLRIALEEGGQRGLPQVQDIAAICLANILSSVGRVEEACELYEQGIGTARAINHTWDRLYGQIYEALLWVELGREQPEKLLSLGREAAESSYVYLEFLAHSFFCVTSLSGVPNQSLLIHSISACLGSMYPGARLYAQIALLAAGVRDPNLLPPDLLATFVETLFSVQGLKGRPGVVRLIVESMDSKFSIEESARAAILAWVERFVPETAWLWALKSTTNFSE